ncbi:MAG: UDP-3-O-acyl-N-acetylglucosamine deacetylase [Pseudomonadota bacterium]
MQATLANETTFTGVGVHGGHAATARVAPAEPGAGVTFIRTDLPHGRNHIPARFDRVADTRLCTVLANEHGATVSTVEHLMAALAGLGVTNATIAIDGPEVPIMDGSAAPFVRALSETGVVFQRAPQTALRILREISVDRDGKRASLAPADSFEMRFEIDFTDAAIGRQTRSMTLVNGAFIEELCDARTFGRLADLEKLRNTGLCRGGSLENAIVVDGAKVLNKGGLRHQDEFVRHKMLDAIGDLALAGAPIIGRYEGVRAGHEMTNLLLRELFTAQQAHGDVFEHVDYDRAMPKALGLCLTTA